MADVVFAGARTPVVLALPLGDDRRPAVLARPDPDRLASPVARHRLAGAYEGWTGTGGDRGAVRVSVPAHNSQAAGRLAALELLTGPTPPDAALAMSDELALGVLAAARELGVEVPGRLAVSGFDGSAGAAAAGADPPSSSRWPSRAGRWPGPSWTPARTARARCRSRPGRWSCGPRPGRAVAAVCRTTR